MIKNLKDYTRLAPRDFHDIGILIRALGGTHLPSMPSHRKTGLESLECFHSHPSSLFVCLPAGHQDVHKAHKAHKTVIEPKFLSGQLDITLLKKNFQGIGPRSAGKACIGKISPVSSFGF